LKRTTMKPVIMRAEDRATGEWADTLPDQCKSLRAFERNAQTPPGQYQGASPSSFSPSGVSLATWAFRESVAARAIEFSPKPDPFFSLNDVVPRGGCMEMYCAILTRVLE